MTRVFLSTAFSMLLVGLVSVGVVGCSDHGQDGDVTIERGAITGNWTNLTLLHNWANYGTSHAPAVGIVDGIVTFRGALKLNGAPTNAIPFSLADPAFAAFRTTDGNLVSVPTVMWQPTVGDVVGSVFFTGSFMNGDNHVSVYQDPNPGNDNTVGPGAAFFTSLEGVSYDTTVGTGIPVDPTLNWGSEYGHRQDVGGGFCPGDECGAWVKSVNGFIRFQGFLVAHDKNPLDFDGHLFTLTDSTYIPGTVVNVPADLDDGTSWGSLTFNPNGTVYVNGNPPAADLGVSFEGVWFSKTNTGNVALPLSHGWTAFSSRQVKVGTYGGVVRFQGGIVGGTAATIATLAAAYRPAAQIRLTAVANGPVPATVVIDTTGVMTVEGVPLNVASQYLSLDGLSYGL